MAVVTVGMIEEVTNMRNRQYRITFDVTIYSKYKELLSAQLIELARRLECELEYVLDIDGIDEEVYVTPVDMTDKGGQE